MIHFLYLFSFSVFVAIAFAALSTGDIKERAIYGLKVFAQFLLISLVLAWVLYFIPF
jgi:hypothetical protein